LELETLGQDEARATPESSYAPRRRTVVPLLLLLLFLALFAIMFVESAAWKMPFKDLVKGPFSPEFAARFGALYVNPLSGMPQWWRLVTAAFVHLGLLHLVFNCYCVYNLGRAIELYYGSRRMFVSWLACSVVANAVMVGTSTAPAIHIGTLGGLFGLDGMMLGFALRNREALPKKSFHWMIGNALFWPAFWVILSLSMLEEAQGIIGLLAGFGAGFLMGIAFRAAGLRRRAVSADPVNLLFALAIAACIVSWGTLLRGADNAVRRTPGGRAEGPIDPAELGLYRYVSKAGGFELPVPDDLNVVEGDDEESVSIGLRDGLFCRVYWRDAGPYDELESLYRSAVSEASLKTSGIEDVTLRHRESLRVGGEQAVFFVLGGSVRGREGLWAHAMLIHNEKVYTIAFAYKDEDDFRQRQADAMVGGFRFIDSGERE
jgi:rhomboid protease GluP